MIVEPSLDLRVLSGTDRVIVYAHEPDRPCSCYWGDFPEVGMCVGINDTPRCTCEPSPASCIERVAIESDGHTLDELVVDWDRYGREFDFVLPALATSVAPQVVVEGCGGRAEIPLGASGPNATLTITRTSAETAHVEWTTDRPAASAMVASSSSIYGELCQVAAQAHDLQLMPSGSAWVTIQALDAPVTQRTPLGDALVYPTGFSSQSMVPP